jgi:hypothetical protein
MKAAASHVEELVKSPGFAELCQKNGEIGFDVLRACFLPKVPDPAREITHCPNCGESEWLIDGGSELRCGDCNELF